ncbi:AAA family ATPase [Streptomyces sp. APSN-46.1]|uniref:helix-turn-helix transcriptional regulator n=1 Tax=Streptomyces sp. APSN-46.1 TaxID=2929049 RepID=UPI001FB240D2|nr:LuxR family transcriptional regulator [Streptomyces sp. APSN-46.1]MCJ1678341.1 AAA family ATPase [Streptomyces sp. APSN-46.1]
MLVERAEHLDRLRLIQEESRAGKGRMVLLEGPSAAGKTELLHVFADQAEAAGFQLLHAVCSRSDQDLPFGVAKQLLRAAGLSTERLSPAAEAAEDGAGTDLTHSVDELCTALLEHSDREPLLLAVDDAQYADAPSLRVLLHLSRRLRSARITVLLVENTDIASPHRLLKAELLRNPRLSRIRVAPLTEEGSTEFLVRRLGPRSAERHAAELHAVSGGNPLLLGALADDRDSGHDDARGYGLALLSCLHRGEATFLAVARAVAVLDTDATPDGVAALAAMERETVEATRRTMAVAGLLTDEGELRHPRARAAVLEDIAPRERSTLHQRAARLLYEGGAEANRVARHLLEAGRADQPWAVQVLLDAADHERFADRPDTATACLELAHRSSGDKQERATVLARLTHTAFQRDPSAALRHLASLLAAEQAGHLAFHESTLLLRQLLWHGRTQEAATLLDRMRSGAADRSTGPGSELADLEQWLSWAHPSLARPVGTSNAAAQRGGTVVTLRSDPWLGRAAALADQLARNRPGAAERAEQVLWDLRLSRGASWADDTAMLALLALLQYGSADHAADWCERLITDAQERSATTWQAVFTGIRAEIAVRQGDLTAAVDCAQEALAVLPLKSWGVMAGLPLSSLIVATTRLGQYEEASRHLAQSVPDALYESWFGLSYLEARGVLHLATNHHHAALADFLSCGELQRGWGVDTTGPVPWRVGAAEACVRLGNTDRARQLVHEQLARPGAGNARTRGLALRLYAATSQPGRGLQQLTESLELLESAGDRYEQARVLGDMSRTYYALGEHRRARTLFRQGLHVAHACKAHPLAQELLSGSAEQPAVVSTTATDPLTDVLELSGSEKRVASLAVMGYTNREIAAKLYITASTVEQHLTRVYRKLRVKRRQDLPADLWMNATRAG